MTALKAATRRKEQNFDIQQAHIFGISCQLHLSQYHHRGRLCLQWWQPLVNRRSCSAPQWLLLISVYKILESLCIYSSLLHWKQLLHQLHGRYHARLKILIIWFFIQTTKSFWLEWAFICLISDCDGGSIDYKLKIDDWKGTYSSTICISLPLWFFTRITIYLGRKC